MYQVIPTHDILYPAYLELLGRGQFVLKSGKLSYWYFFHAI